MNSTVSHNFRPMFVFTVLSLLFVFTLLLLALVMKTAQGNEAIVAILNTAVGSVLTLIGVIVNYEFGGAKQRDAAARGSDQPGAQVTSRTTTATTTVVEPKAEPEGVKV